MATTEIMKLDILNLNMKKTTTIIMEMATVATMAMKEEKDATRQQKHQKSITCYHMVMLIKNIIDWMIAYIMRSVDFENVFISKLLNYNNINDKHQSYYP